MDAISASQRKGEAARAPRAQGVLDALRPPVGGRRGLIIAAIALVVAGLVMGWNWVVALGIAPLILSLAPCAIMCALGLCMMGMGRRSSSAKEGSATDVAETVAQSEEAAAPLTTTVERGSTGGA